MRFAVSISVLGVFAACQTNPPPPEMPVAEAQAAETTCEARTFDVYFANGAYELSDAARTVIDMVAAEAALCGGHRIEIEGHTDASGTADVNEQIAAARAEAVLDELVVQGVAAEQIDIITFGEAGALTPDGRDVPLNRKTVITLVPLHTGVPTS